MTFVATGLRVRGLLGSVQRGELRQADVDFVVKAAHGATPERTKRKRDETKRSEEEKVWGTQPGAHGTYVGCAEKSML